ncbi:MAG: hypothetical protein KF812_13775, partial [Fimbriimonadaceae bacterium]|nr:hypothetical protein [Fimbriimonadaceae bacterium]
MAGKVAIAETTAAIFKKSERERRGSHPMLHSGPVTYEKCSSGYRLAWARDLQWPSLMLSLLLLMTDPLLPR